MNLFDLNLLLATIGGIGGAIIMVFGIINNQIKNNMKMINKELELRLNNIDMQLSSYKSIIDNELNHIRSNMEDIKTQLNNIWEYTFEQTLSGTKTLKNKEK